MRAAEKCAFLFEPVTDDMNTAISAGRSERMDSTLEAIEDMGPPIHVHLKRFVVVISAYSHLAMTAAIRLGNSASTYKPAPSRVGSASAEAVSGSPGPQGAGSVCAHEPSAGGHA
jgi:hypothetical protein